ncbi:sulfotransferase family protein [Paenibacillus sp. V4I7]|uniref:sulfotransferase family protein n=1 Tax=Paenibacillus sp. V4I7 TaxID=3042307 RepID=UPI0027837E5E|nr:hypothetical protein [Paenibacillus sp. V4I7]MDQ0901547.1 hypothetical protein [Paenibacillus sp. V4I7]
MNSSRAIGIIGSGRSGTSLVTKELELLGVHLGGPLDFIPPDNTNPDGFWENKHIVGIQQLIFKKLGWSWEGLNLLPPDWKSRSELVVLKEQLKKYISDNFFHKSLWGWKDPRTCSLLPIWEELLQELKMIASYVIVIRNPLDVAHSLYRCDPRISLDHALHIWTFRTLSSLYWTESNQRVVIHYDQMIEDWEGTLKQAANRLSIPWPQPEKQVEKEMSRIIKPQLRHSKTGEKALIESNHVSALTLNTYQLCMSAISYPDFLTDELMHQCVKQLFEQYTGQIISLK